MIWRKNHTNDDGGPERDAEREAFPVPSEGATGTGTPADAKTGTGNGPGNVVPLRSVARPGPGSVPGQDRVRDGEPVRDSVPGSPGVAGVRVEQVPADPDADDITDGEVVEGVLVDLPPGAVPGVLPWQRDTDRRDAVPLWLRDSQTRAEAVRWARGLVWHKTKFHAVRSPWYAAVLAVRAPRGLARVTTDLGRWATDAESLPLRLDAVRRGDASEYVRLSAQSESRRRGRGALLMLAGGAVLVGIVAVVFAAPAPLAVLLAAGALGWLGARGGSQDAPLIGRAVVTAKVPQLTSEMIIRALGSLGIGEINRALKHAHGITFPSPITRDGPGFRCDVDLPLGVTVTHIMDKRPELASALRRPLGCVWPEPSPGHHEGRLVLWVGDRDMAQTPPVAWPLTKAGTVSLFEPFAFGRDPRGRTVPVTLMFDNMLIGAMPRYGKTFAMRVVMLAAALDPLARLFVYELKGTGDLAALEHVAEGYASGADDRATFDATMAGLRIVFAELSRRAKVISDLPRDICPENKVTPDLAKRKSLGLAPIVLGIDECQELFTHPVYGAEAADLCVKIIKRGPALGIMLVLATQRPNKDSLPTDISANVGIRLCLRVKGQVENDMVLGTSAYKNGIRATQFGPRDKGIGILDGHADEHQIVRSFYIDGPTADTIATRARALREAAGTLAGYAAGDTPQIDARPAVSLLDDIAAVLQPDEDKVWSETVCERLADLRPEHYQGWAPTQLAAALKPYGITTRQTWLSDPPAGKKNNQRGFTRADLDTARNKTRATTGRTAGDTGRVGQTGQAGEVAADDE